MRRVISRNCSTDITKKQISCSTPTNCDDLQDLENGVIIDDGFCCVLEYGTVIDAPDFIFAADTNYTNIETLFIDNQQSIDFLPVLVHEKFPILKKYVVFNTPVKKISKRNFEKMYELKELELNRNQIEVIRSNTFEDLTKLEQIFVGMNLFRRIFFVIKVHALKI